MGTTAQQAQSESCSLTLLIRSPHPLCLFLWKLSPHPGYCPVRSHVLPPATLWCSPVTSRPPAPQSARVSFPCVTCQLRRLSQLRKRRRDRPQVGSSGAGLCILCHLPESPPCVPKPPPHPWPSAVTSVCPSLSGAHTWSGSSLPGAPPQCGPLGPPAPSKAEFNAGSSRRPLWRCPPSIPV